MRAHMNEYMVAPLVRLTASLHVAPVVRNKFTLIRKSSRKRLQERLVELETWVKFSPVVSFLAEAV